MKGSDMWNLYLDDEREPKPTYISGVLITEWNVARSSAEAIELVGKFGMPWGMSLDHDLGGDDTTMKFLHWLTNNAFYQQAPFYVVHSQNPVGRNNIISYMENWIRAQED